MDESFVGSDEEGPMSPLPGVLSFARGFARAAQVLDRTAAPLESDSDEYDMLRTSNTDRLLSRPNGRHAAEVEPEVETNIDHITGMAAKMFNVPACLLSVIDEHRSWFKSIVGWSKQAEIERDEHFCNPEHYKHDFLVVPDALKDPRFANSPLVLGPPFIRFYAGTPLQGADGFALGTLCIIDDKPRQFSQDQLSCLQDVACLIIQELEQRLMAQLMLGISKASQILMDSSLDVSGAVESVAQVIFTTLGLRSLELLLAEPSAGGLPYNRSFILGGEDLPLCRASSNHVYAVASSQTPLFFNKNLEVVEFPEGATAPSVIRSTMVGLPLPVNDQELHGVMFLYNHIERPYTPSDVDFLKSVIWSLASYLQRKKAEQASEELLVNILPDPIVQQLKMSRKSVARHIPRCTILFADFVGFTSIASRLKPDQVVSTLFNIFSAFDWLTEKWSVEKVKTIGDAYMACAGVAVPNIRHAECCVELALDMIAAIRQFSAKHMAEPVYFRFGINSGPVVAGVLSLKRLAFDVFGDTVNVAARMEQLSEPNCIRVTASTWEELNHDRYIWEMEEVHVKGKGTVTSYLIRGRSPAGEREADSQGSRELPSPILRARRHSEPMLSMRRSGDVDLNFPSLRRSSNEPSSEAASTSSAASTNLRRSANSDPETPTTSSAPSIRVSGRHRGPQA